MNRTRSTIYRHRSWLVFGMYFELPDEILGIDQSVRRSRIYLGIEAPDDENIAAALEESDFGGGAQLTVFLPMRPT